MFTCIICSEPFLATHHNSTYTTHCGHVYHYQCILSWLERSPTCPHCRSTVLENDLIRLFLQVDNLAQRSHENTIEETGLLKKQLKRLKKKLHKWAKLKDTVQTKILSTTSALDIKLNHTSPLKEDLDQLKKKSLKLNTKLTSLEVQYDASENVKFKLQEEWLLLKSKVELQHHELYNFQSSNASTIDQLKLEIADLKSDKAYYQRRNNIKNINIEQPSTSKMEMNNINAMSLQNQTKIEYYGHDPQLQLTTKQFLFGCVFLFVEVQIQHEDNICKNTTISKKNIIKYGGSVEQNYSEQVTHIICATQKHHIVEQGIKDGKRCITDYWLKDIIAKKSMIPPWLAFHFPIPYSHDNLPCQHFQFSIDNFDKNEDFMIKTMIKLVGGQCVVQEVTFRTDIIVSLKIEGEIVEKALAINKPVVNVQWLNDILFGALLGLKEPAHLKYQQFGLCNPFIVNYDMVSHLMEAWRTPLTIHKNHQVYDLMLNPNSSTQCKRQKTKLIVDDNDVIITYIKNLPPKPCVMLSDFSVEQVEMFKMMLRLLGGTIASHHLEATHLIMSMRAITSIEFFCCFSTVKYIVNERWLQDSHSNLKFLDERKYSMVGVRDRFLGFFELRGIFDKNTRSQLFRNMLFFVTPGIQNPLAPHLEDIISSAGGTIESSRRPIESIQELTPNSYIIISSQEYHFLYNDLLNTHKVVYLPEFITSSILTQEIQLQKYLLEVTA